MPEPTTHTTPPPATAAEGSAPDEGKGGKSAVLADLATERDKRQALESQMQQLQQAHTAQAEAIAKAFGLKADEASDVSKLSEQITALRDDFNTTKHENTVLAVANQFGISDADDLKLLRSVTDSDTMRSLAQRMAPASSMQPVTAPGPRPDLTQGGKHGAQHAATPNDAFASFLQNALK